MSADKIEVFITSHVTAKNGKIEKAVGYPISRDGKDLFDGILQQEGVVNRSVRYNADSWSHTEEGAKAQANKKVQAEIAKTKEKLARLEELIF